MGCSPGGVFTAARFWRPTQTTQERLLARLGEWGASTGHGALLSMGKWDLSCSTWYPLLSWCRGVEQGLWGGMLPQAGSQQAQERLALAPHFLL